MSLRKINAGFSLITSALLFVHAIFLAVWMLSRGSVPNTEKFAPWILTGVTAVHALLSIGVMISSHIGDKSHKGKAYPKLNVSTIVQRVTGILMLLFTWLHVAGAAGYMTPPQVVHAIVPPLFFALTMAHVAVSVSKAFITLGVGSAKFVNRVDIAIKVICVVTLIADVIGFYLHVC